ncbi:arsenate reductase ArsC [Thermoleophilia bacterium SCSIO 60948]|nr:arsenate reductase ArsC [Thermoleophilia bacterium SCSIO 60948]
MLEQAAAGSPLSGDDLEREVEALAEEFSGIFARETIERYVTDSAIRAAGARGTALMPLFVRRMTHDRLEAVAQREGLMSKEVPEVLFVCVHNAGRSQMAAGLLDRRAAGAVNVRTAGSEPADRVNPVAVEAMAELGIDLSKEFPKPLTGELVEAADVVITMGCGDACPIYPGKRYEDWKLDDPAGQGIEQVRAIRDEIADRVDALVASLGAERAESR